MKNVAEINSKLEALEAEADALSAIVESNPADKVAARKLANVLADHSSLVFELTH